mgnify:CR=1 FL=1
MLPSDLATLPTRAREDFLFWRELLSPLLVMERGVSKAIADLADRSGQSEGTIRKKFYLVKRSGWSAIIDRRLCGPAAWNASESRSLSHADKELLKTA